MGVLGLKSEARSIRRPRATLQTHRKPTLNRGFHRKSSGTSDGVSSGAVMVTDRTLTSSPRSLGSIPRSSTMAKREPYPLQWPDGWKRTKSHYRLRSRFGNSGHVSFSNARHSLLVELDRLGAANAVITSDLPTRHDGLPYANGRAEDPGVAVWFVLPNERGNLEERVFACDKWLSHAENMQAIAKSIEAMRGLERWGAADVVQRAFSGFAALPPGVPLGPAKRPWREVLGVSALEGVLDVAKRAHRDLIRKHHPDAGGSHELAAEINAALAEAERELGTRS